MIFFVFRFLYLTALGSLFFSWLPLAECCSGGSHASSSGTIDCPSDGVDYSNNLNVTWNIRASGIIKIRFTKLDVEQCYDKVFIYQNTSYATPNLERFRLCKPDVNESEFLLSAPVIVRFETDGSVTKSGFRLHYESIAVSIPAATEVITQHAGVRRSHPGDGSYTDGYSKAWSIYVPRDSQIFIQFTKFDTESCCDLLKIYRRIVPGYYSVPLHTISGNLTNALPSYWFQQNITLLFSTEGSVVRAGFEFNFKITESLSIELIDLDLWSLTGVIHFSALSNRACPNLVHRCELRSSGSTFVAQTMKTEAFPGPRFCSGSVVTNFSVVAVPSAESTIFCHLASGVNKTKPLPPMKLQAQNIHWNFSELSFNVSVTTVAMIQSAECYLQHECDSGATKILTRFAGSLSQGGMAKTFEFHGSLPGTQACSSNIFCTFKSPGMIDLTRSTSIPPAYPDSVSIEPLNPQLWSLNGMVQFRLVSLNACPSVLHQCWVTAAHASIAAQQVNRMSSRGSYTQCKITLTTDFVVPAQLISTNSSVQCRLKNDNTAMRRLPLISLESHRVRWNLAKWEGGPAPIALSVSLDPKPTDSVWNRTSVRCWPRYDCQQTDTAARVGIRNASEFRVDLPAISNESACVKEVTCEFSGAGLQTMRSSIVLPPVDPETIKIELIRPELWPLTGVLQFQAVSEFVCSRTRHRCEIRTPENDSLLVSIIKKDFLEPSGTLCLSSVTSQFAVADEAAVMAGSVIQCRLLNGDSALLELPRHNLDSRLAKVWERPLLATASALSVLTTAAFLAAACALVTRTGSGRLRRELVKASAAEETIKMQPPYNQYSSESTCKAEDLTGVYVT